jgi:hypothetical protein
MGLRLILESMADLGGELQCAVSWTSPPLCTYTRLFSFIKMRIC